MVIHGCRTIGPVAKEPRIIRGPGPIVNGPNQALLRPRATVMVILVNY
jgi:hypothetical protein